MYEEYPSDRFVYTAMGPVEWRRDITDPNVLFDREERIVQSEYVQSAGELVLNDAPVARGMNWNELTQGVGNGEHRLRAIVNVNNQNIGLVDTLIDNKPVTYITRMAVNKQEKGDLLAILDTPVEGDATFSVVDRSNRWEGLEHDLVTFKRTADGQLSLTNESLEALRVGMGSELKSEHNFRERFSFRSVYQGLRRAIVGDRQSQTPGKYEAFVGTTNWMVSAVDSECTIAEFTRYMRQNNCTWYAAQPI